jgi:hypothetical protein
MRLVRMPPTDIENQERKEGSSVGAENKAGEEKGFEKKHIS